ncbi:unnamed protein product [Urochloa decumbens]|uniref:VQ domain-containing protein n=1 Tax=Urochloa decumbens TaxID=240449 RepID=A0ABC9EP18_9POAL
MASSGDSASSLADAAIARALHYSMAASSGDSAAPHQYNCSALLADLTLPAHATCDSVLLVADPPPGGGRRHQHQHQHQQLAVVGGRAGKQRRSRASKRAPTTYISTDPANFRVMVHHITGLVQEADDHMLLHQAAAMLAADASAAAAGASASALQHHQLQQQPCFPTLDSWNVMYERTDLL